MCDVQKMVAMGYRDACWGALVVVACFAVWRFARDQPDGEVRPENAEAPCASAVSSSRALSSQKALLQRALLACRAEVKQCQDQGWSLVGRFVSGQDQGGPSAAAEPNADKELPKSSQGDDLRDVVFRQVQLDWLRKRGRIEKALRDATSEQGVAREIKRRVAAHTKRFSLSEPFSEQLNRRYTDLWSRHRARMEAELKAGDYSALVETAKGFWQAEDGLVGEVLGPSRKQDYSRSERRSRLGLVALLSTLGGIQPDDSVRDM